MDLEQRLASMAVLGRVGEPGDSDEVLWGTAQNLGVNCGFAWNRLWQPQHPALVLKVKVLAFLPWGAIITHKVSDRISEAA